MDSVAKDNTVASVTDNGHSLHLDDDGGDEEEVVGDRNSVPDYNPNGNNDDDIDDADELLMQRRPLRPAWNPNISILELAYKLKRAEQNVFGPVASCNATQPVHKVARAFENHHAANATTAPHSTPLGFGYQAKTMEPIDSAFAHAFFAEYPSCAAAATPAAQPATGIPRGSPRSYGSGGFHMPPTATTSVPNSARYPGDAAGPVPVSLVSVRDNGSLHQQPAFQCFQPKVSGAGWPEAVVNSERVDEDEMPADDAELSNESGIATGPRHQCKQCTYSTKSMHHLRRHCASVHTHTKPYQCYVCMMEFARSEKVREHFVSFHPDVAYEPKMVRKFPSTPVHAPRDAAATDTKSRIRELFRDIEGEDLEFETDHERPFGCLRCSYATRDLWHLRRHVLDVHAMRKQHNCRVCRYATNRSNRLAAHMRGHGELFCEYCSFSSTNVNYFVLHDKICAAAANAATGSGSTIGCHLCPFRCESRRELSVHVGDSHGMEMMLCGDCPFYAYNGDDFDAHIRAHLALRRTCKLCTDTFESSESHDEHDDSVHLVQRGGVLLCVVCDTATDTTKGPEGPRAHVRSHSPERLSCTTAGCGFKATLDQSLEMHTRYYHGASTGPPDALPQRPKVEPIPTLPSPAGGTPPSASQVGIFACSVCGPKRMPFKYWRSYEKHMAQHGVEAMPRR